MKWRGETSAELRIRKARWNKWFAWRPVLDESGYWHWLEYVERRSWNAAFTEVTFYYFYRGLDSK